MFIQNLNVSPRGHNKTPLILSLLSVILGGAFASLAYDLQVMSLTVNQLVVGSPQLSDLVACDAGGNSPVFWL